MLRTLGADALRAWCEAGRDALAAARVEIDGLNVYPVPDGDTGTNLLLTLEAGLEELRAAGTEHAEDAAETGPADVARSAAALARGALLGARGNSGVLLSQLLQGLADVLADGPADSAGLARGLELGADRAYAAVADPVEGTLLSVARGAADAALAAAGAADDDLAAVAGAARDGAAAALAHTQEQLPALRAAGVVDAGGRGWLLLLETLLAVVSEQSAPPERVEGPTGPGRRPAPAVERPESRTGYSYEVQYLLRDSDEASVDRLRAVLHQLGDSLAVVGADGVWNVHVHVDDVAAAVEAGLDAGRPYRISVERFADALSPAAAQGPPRRAVVAVVGGKGAARLFTDAGAVVVEAGPPAPTPPRLLEAVLATGACSVALLPNSDGVLAAARAAAEQAGAAGVVVTVVPTRSLVQGLAALAVTDDSRDPDDDLQAMVEAAAATRFGEVTCAVHEATTSAGLCLPGDALGLLDGRIVLVGADPEWVARGLLDRLGDGAELVTLVLGADAPAGLGDRLRAHVAGGPSRAEVVVLDGGMARPLLLMGAE